MGKVRLEWFGGERNFRGCPRKKGRPNSLFWRLSSPVAVPRAGFYEEWVVLPVKPSEPFGRFTTIVRSMLLFPVSLFFVLSLPLPVSLSLSLPLSLFFVLSLPLPVSLSLSLSHSLSLSLSLALSLPLSLSLSRSLCHPHGKSAEGSLLWVVNKQLRLIPRRVSF